MEITNINYLDNMGIINTRGKVTNISKELKTGRNGNFYIMQIRTEANELISLYCFDYVYQQIKTEQILDGDIIQVIGKLGHYEKDGKECVSYRALCATKYLGTLLSITAKINSEWLKTTSKGPDIWQFTLKTLHKKGLVYHCTVDRTSIFMRNIDKGATVRVIGKPAIKIEEDEQERLTLDIIYLEPVTEV